jgi:hypothetical protein
MSELPPAPRHRKPHEVEDILCIYKHRFEGPARRVSVTLRSRTTDESKGPRPEC